MTSIRLLPIVLVAITALLILKTIGLVTNHGYTLTGVSSVQAQSQSDQGNNQTAQDNRLSTIDEEAAKRAADALFSETSSSVSEEGQQDAAPVFEDLNGEIGLFVAGDGSENSQEAVLQRLSQRRGELDAREQALKLQENLVVAAETRLDERIASLKAVEARVQALLDQQDAVEEAQFDALVSMYANMKASDAAKVFNSLNMDILLRLATKMSPRKMSPILASMSVERAQQLTIQIATAQISNQTIDVASASSAPGDNALPQIVGQ